MTKNTLSLQPTMSSNLENAKSGNNIGEQWPLHEIPRNRILYKLYYYLLSKSGFDHLYRHSYISDYAWTKKDASERIGCTPRTINNNLKTLIEKGIIERDDARKAYIFTHPIHSAYISYDILGAMLDLDGTIDSVMAIRILSVINYAYYHGVPKFCVNDIKSALGSPKFDGEFIRVCLAWWQSLGILEYTQKRVSHGYCSYIVFEITKLDTESPISQLGGGLLTEEYEELFNRIQF